MMDAILVIEDEDKIARLLEMELIHEGYSVTLANTGRLGLEMALQHKWDLILLDIMLPELNGLEVLRRLRQADVRTPVMLLTARDETPDKVSGLDQGANDYITKPFEIEEVLARIRACLRTKQEAAMKTGTGNGSNYTIDDLTLNTSTRVVTRNNEFIELTPTEFDLLLYLMEHSGHVLSREQIMNQVWGYDFVGDTNVVDVYIRYLRKKIDYPYTVQLIQTHRGIGYSMKEPENEYQV